MFYIFLSFQINSFIHMLYAEIRTRIILLYQTLELLRKFKLNFIVLIVLYRMHNIYTYT